MGLDVGLIVVAAVVGAAMAVRLDLGLIVLAAVVRAAMTVGLDVGLPTVVAAPIMALAVGFELVHVFLLLVGRHTKTADMTVARTAIFPQLCSFAKTW
ncbi:MAG TPA: hypothetical protein VFL67_09150 [Mycobacterium sp.]|nr:hypothetical protein [Mycobacterium sp.]